MSTAKSRLAEAGPLVLQGHIELRPIAELKPYAANARRHPKSQITKLAAAVQEFGFVAPVLVDAESNLLAGHARLEAAKRLRMDSVPTLRVEHLTEQQRRAFIIADNRLSDLAGWDDARLKQELQALVDLDFPVEVIGYETPDLDKLLRVIDEDDEAPEVDQDAPLVARLGDLFQLGRHRVYCGDSTLRASYEAVLDRERARLVFTDPPYNVPIQGHVSSNRKHGEFAMASGEMSQEQFTNFLDRVAEHLGTFSVDGSIHFVCMDWRHMTETLGAARPHYELLNLVVWNKDNGGMGSLYRSKHELIFVFKSGKAPHVNNVELGRHGRNRTNVWNYPGATSMSKSRAKRLQMHPTVKPVSMIADAILDCSHRDDLVLDPFGGSGSTLLAAESTGRRAALIELDPKYVDVILRRYEERTGTSGVHVESGLTFSELAAQRLGSAE